MARTIAPMANATVMRPADGAENSAAPHTELTSANVPISSARYFLVLLFIAFSLPHARRARTARIADQISAISRTGPPVEPFTLASPTTRIASDGDSFSMLATFSRPQRPDGSQVLWVLKSFDGPLSSDSVSTARPSTLRSFNSHSASSGETPGKWKVPEASLPVYLAASPTLALQPDSMATQQLFGSFLNRFSQVSTSSMPIR